MYTLNNRVLMSDALHFSIDQPINPYYGNDSLNLAKATEEHHAIRDALEKAGVAVVTVPSPVNSQDGVYTANWAIVKGDIAVMARLPDVRKAEEAHAETILASLGKTIVKLPSNVKFSGQGDALQCGPYLFCGSGYRSDESAQKQAADALGLERIQLQTVPMRDTHGKPVINEISGWADSFFYDIDLALAIIRPPSDNRKGLIAYCPEAFTPESQKMLAGFDAVDTILISLEEAQQAFAANLVSTGTCVVMSAHAPQLKAELEARGLTVYCPEVQELAKGGGYIRCTSLSLD